MTVGPWRPISLQYYDTRIGDIRVTPTIAADKSVKVDVSFEVSSNDTKKASVVVRSLTQESIAAASVNCENGIGKATLETEPGKLEFWYPVGYGKHPLYVVEIELSDPVRHASFD